MNVIFVDFDGTFYTSSDSRFEYEQGMPKKEIDKRVERRIKTLADICKKYDCKVVIEAAAKTAIDETTMEVAPHAKWIEQIFEMFQKYGIECIGRTPSVSRPTSSHSEYSMWKEDEIRLYLYRHPEIEHYAVIDDDDTITTLHWKKSDLDKVRKHLVITQNHSFDQEEGLLPSHEAEVGKALEQDNEIRNMVLAKREQPLPNGGIIRIKDVYDMSDQLQDKKWQLKKLKREIKQQEDEMRSSCSHEIVFKFNNNKPRKKIIEGYYYCPACGKWTIAATPDYFEHSSFKESIVIPLPNLSLRADEETFASISNEVQENMDLYYSSILTVEEMSARMEAILSDEQYDYSKPLSLRRNNRKWW